MNGPQQNPEEFRITNLFAEERESNLPIAVIEYVDNPSCYAEYSKGVELETAEGEVIEEDAAGVEMIHVADDLRRRGIGTRLLTRLIEEAKEADCHYLRIRTIVNPLTISLIERMAKAGHIRRHTYFIHQPEELFDVMSDELLEAGTGLTADQASVVVAEDLEREEDENAAWIRVECVAEL